MTMTTHLRFIGALAVVVALFFLIFYERPYAVMADARQAYAEAGEGPVVVALIDDPGRENFALGVRLALDEINTQSGGLLGRPVQLKVVPGGGSFEALRPTLRRLADDPAITAVLGHRYSSVAMPASVIYEEAKILFLPSFATDPMLTGHDFRSVFRMLPDYSVMADQAASLAVLLGHRRMAVLHQRQDYDRELAFLFEDAARRQGIDIVFSGSFFGYETNYRSLLGRMLGLEVDAVFLSSGTEAGARMLRQMREMSLRHPVIGTDSLGAGNLGMLTGAGVERVIVPTIYDETRNNERNRTLIDAWKARYPGEPNDEAALGYDAMSLFAHAVRRAGSSEFGAIEAAKRYSPPVVGASGFYAYDEQGDVYGKTYGFKVWRGGQWWPLDGVEQPYRLERLIHAVKGMAAAAPLETEAKAKAEAEATMADIAKAEQDAPVIEAARSTSSGDALRERLVIAHQILDFERLGLVVMTGKRSAALQALVRTVGEEQGFDVETCEIKAPAPPKDKSDDPATLDTAALVLRCYSIMASGIDAMLSLPEDTGVDAAVLKRLNRALLSFDVAAIGLPDRLGVDHGLTLAVAGAQIDLDDPSQTQRFDGLLNNMRIFDLRRQLQRFPMVAANFDALETLGIRLKPQILDIISDSLETDPVEGNDS